MDTSIRSALPSPAAERRGVDRRVSDCSVPEDLRLSDRREPATLPGFPQFGVFNAAATQSATPQGRQQIADAMAAQLKAWPQLTAVVGVVPEGSNTGLIVASRPGEAEDSKLAGFYEIMQRLASSDAVREAARQHPNAVQPVHDFDPQGKDREITLGGPQSLQDVAAEMAVGGQTGRDNQLQDLLASLPQGQRVVILVGGPSAAGKSSLINDLTRLGAGLGRKVVDYTGDNYFRNSDDPRLPMTANHTPYWDAPEAMDMEGLASDIGKLASTGHVEERTYDFAAKPPESKVAWSGMRTDKTIPVDLGQDDILAIDSLHAMNPVVIHALESAKLPYACIYLDSREANIREVRRIVRDFGERGRSPEQSIADWKDTTFPGEVKFIRPDIQELQPGRDVFRITSFPADITLSQEDIEARVKAQEAVGLQPSYAAFARADADLPAFAQAEATRLQGVVDDPKSTPAQSTAAQAAMAQLR